ncbi:MAG TPA: PAS domain S-box protein [Anaerolineales bacterium]|nr:PAS domain S-box protein [Anaerolineales bacterium]
MQKMINSELRYRRLFEAAQDGILILDAKTGMIEDVNPYLIKILGYSREEFIKKRIWEVGAFIDIESSKEAFEALQENEYIRYEDLPLRTKGGRLIQVEFVSNVYQAGEEKVIQCNIRDITEHKQIIAALQENEKKYHDLIDQSPDGYFIIEVSGNILTVNEAMCKALKFNEEEFLSMSIWDIIPEKLLDQYRERLTKILKGESLQEAAEYEVYGKNGNIHYVEVLSAPRYSGGNIIGFQGVARNISDRKRAESALLESEEKFRKLVKHLPTMVYTVAIGGTGASIYVSPQIETLFGYTSDEWLADPELWSKSLHPDDRQHVLKRTGHTDQINKPFNMEYRMFTRDGRLMWVHDQVTLVYDPKGQPIYWQGIILDVTERKQMEHDIRLRTEDLSLINTLNEAANLGKNINDLVIILTNELKGMIPDYHSASVYLLDSNAKYLQLRNLTLPAALIEKIENVIGRPIPNIEIPIQKDGYFQKVLGNEQGNIINDPRIIQQWIAEFTETTSLSPLIRKGLKKLIPQIHKLLNIKSVATVPLISSGKTIGLLDVTTSKYNLTEDNLKRIRDISSQVTAVIIRKQAEDQLTIANQELLHQNEEKEKQAAELVVANDGLRKAKADLGKLNEELEQRVIDRTQQLTQANRTKGEFFASMSHELRTPLNSILGLSETLLEQRRGPLNEKQEQYIRIMESNGQHLLAVINDILEVSKVEAGKLELRPDIVSIKELCESSLNFIRELAVKKSISVEFKNEQLISTLRADPQRLKQILVNLLSNAVKFTPANGAVSLEVHLNPEKDQISFSVKDSGIGITPENLPKLFTPFTQLDSSLSRQYEGTGLGLVLVLKLTELHGGSVKVESEPNVGSRFTITLPWSEHNPKEQKKTSKSTPPVNAIQDQEIDSLSWGKILLAEDTESNVLVISDYLMGCGYEVVVAHDGVEAIAMTEELSPDIILMDIQMPKMDGLEAIRRLRTAPKSASVPIIALTALAMPGDRERCLEAGATEYLSKPVSLKTLVKTISELLAR